MIPFFWPPILMLVIFIAAMVWLGYAFLYDLLELFINGVILYFIGLRSYAEVKEGKLNLYIGAGVAGAIVTALSKNFLSGLRVWRFTTWAIVSMALAQGVIIAHHFYGKKKRK